MNKMQNGAKEEYKFDLEDIDCPHCGESSTAETGRGNHELCINCDYCGYILRRTLIEGKTGEDMADYKTEEFEGYGAYRIQRGDLGEVSTFNREITQKDIDIFYKQLAEPDVDPNSSYFCKFDNITKKLTFVYGSLPTEEDEDSL